MPKKDPCSYALVTAIIVSFSISRCILHNDATDNLSRKLAGKIYQAYGVSAEYEFKSLRSCI